MKIWFEGSVTCDEDRAERKEKEEKEEGVSLTRL